MQRSFSIIMFIFIGLIIWEIAFDKLPSGYERVQIPVRSLNIPVASSVFDIPSKKILLPKNTNVKESVPLINKIKRFTPLHLFMNVSHASPEGSCRRNLRFFKASIDNYNRTHSKKIHQLDSSLISSKFAPKGLVFFRPLKVKGDSDCEYRSCGDLASDGVIFCIKHPQFSTK